LDEFSVEVSQLGVVLRHVFEHGGEVEAECSVQLAVDETGRNDAAAEVDGPVRQDESIVKGRLAAEDLAGAGTDPKIVKHEVVAAEQAAVGQLGDAIPRLAGRLHVSGVRRAKKKNMPLIVQGLTRIFGHLVSMCVEAHNKGKLGKY
jgi:hypothetical protein